MVKGKKKAKRCKHCFIGVGSPSDKYHPAMKRVYITLLRGDVQIGWFCSNCGALDKLGIKE